MRVRKWKGKGGHFQHNKKIFWINSNFYKFFNFFLHEFFGYPVENGKLAYCEIVGENFERLLKKLMWLLKLKFSSVSLLLPTILQQFWLDFATILAQFCNNFGSILLQFWPNFGSKGKSLHPGTHFSSTSSYRRLPNTESKFYISTVSSFLFFFFFF